ncbi:MAG: hypothetical protein KAH72_09850, partial [Flavobacteriaceae bacterium]|nr:hypothetical protein [Flavobacteriaceae bacterium]
MSNLRTNHTEEFDFREIKNRTFMNSVFSKPMLVLFFLFTIFFQGISQNIGDYGSIANGNWDDSATWGVWNGSAYITDGTYPGENSGSYDVYIVGGFTVGL